MILFKCWHGFYVANVDRHYHYTRFFRGGNMDVWKKNISEANRFYALRNDIQAIKFYQLAIERSYKLFDYWFDADQAVAALLTSFHSMGDLYIRMGIFDQGLSYYERVQNILASARQNEICENRKSALLRGLNCSTSQLCLLKSRLTEKECHFSAPESPSVSLTAVDLKKVDSVFKDSKPKDSNIRNTMDSLFINEQVLP